VFLVGERDERDQKEELSVSPQRSVDPGQLPDEGLSGGGRRHDQLIVAVQQPVPYGEALYRKQFLEPALKTLRELRVEVEFVRPHGAHVVDVRGDLVVLRQIWVESALKQAHDPVQISRLVQQLFEPLFGRSRELTLIRELSFELSAGALPADQLSVVLDRVVGRDRPVAPVVRASPARPNRERVQLVAVEHRLQPASVLRRRLLGDSDAVGRSRDVNELVRLTRECLTVTDDTEPSRTRACGGVLEFEPPAEYPTAVPGGDDGVVASGLVEKQRFDLCQLL